MTPRTPWGRIDPLHAAAVRCVEKATFNALVANESMTGRRGHRTPALYGPSPRELDVLGLITRGCSNPETAARLALSARTVTTHIVHIFERLGCGKLRRSP
ncbi:LuxR C-terminal-related transcriptional regulator [Streptomyces sp. NBC_01255]|uniref:response regulator transcription factor n=1 Tax=Streptomyces sp. NBC_01255 TaxID=2903798 RepID=UPI002E2F0B62|nr:LuxR C-terminal-related transcriptional regulator [Streptomyces sp. NBC_01255]